MKGRDSASVLGRHKQGEKVSYKLLSDSKDLIVNEMQSAVIEKVFDSALHLRSWFEHAWLPSNNLTALCSIKFSPP